MGEAVVNQEPNQALKPATSVAPKQDLIIVGGGPAGLAMAIQAALRGVGSLVLERGTYPLDKACGEGLMPVGLTLLEQMGVRGLLTPADCTPIEGIRYLQEDGATVEGRLAPPGGLGIRRTALVRALRERALALGVEIREQHRVARVHRGAGSIEVELSTGERLRAGLVVASDGLRSGLRQAEGLALEEERLPRRFGVRRHFLVPDPSRFVEVHFTEGVEAYLTPAGSGRLGVAFLWEARGASTPTDFDSLLSRFPVLQERLQGVPSDSKARGAGPLWQPVRSRVSGRLVLVGDSGGYVDALTGEGVTLAFVGAAALAAELEAALGRGGAAADALDRYDEAMRRAFSRYELFTRFVLGVARRPALRRWSIRALASAPWIFESLVRVGVR